MLQKRFAKIPTFSETAKPIIPKQGKKNCFFRPFNKKVVILQSEWKFHSLNHHTIGRPLSKIQIKMKHFKPKHTCAFRFRRYCRAGYAAFRSMHRVVNIGHLASYIADRQLRKSISAISLCILSFWNIAEAQNETSNDSRPLPVLNITATTDSSQGSPDAIAVVLREQLQGLPISSVGELLEQLPGIDLRTRGASDVQGDLTMRGGTFDQMIILLNGVNLTDAQTGHHNLDIPIDLSMVDRVEIIPASSLINYGLTSFCGAVNIVTTDHSRNQVKAQISAGSFNQLHFSAGVTLSKGDWNWLAATSFHRSSGYMENTDFNHGSLYLQGLKKDSKGEWILQIGGQMKDFGSQAFYSTKYPDQFESTRTLIASICRQRKWRNWHLEALLYGRAHKDRFELFREGYADFPSWYSGHNYHLSLNGGLRLRASRMTRFGKFATGTEIREEGILSNVLGDSLSSPRKIWGESDDLYYPLGKSRLNTNLFAHYSYSFKDLVFKISGLASHNTLSGFNHGYTLSLDWLPNSQWTLNANLGRSMRLPTYNDLYYHSATQISNPNLNVESSYNTEINLKFHKGKFSSLATLYGRHGENIIDWVRDPSETLWHCINHSSIDAVGGDIMMGYNNQGFLHHLGITYSHCTIFQHPDGYISNYALDYLKDKVSGDIVIVPFKNLKVKAMASYGKREGSYTNPQGETEAYKAVMMLNAGAEYHFNHFVIFAEGYNLLNKEYCDYGGVPQPGISFLAGININY